MKNVSELKHIVIIPDGNRRWAKSHKLSLIQGHEEGQHRLKEIIQEAKNIKLPFLTVWAFSTENWSRDKAEREGIFSLIYNGLQDISPTIKEENVTFLHLGRKDRLPKELCDLICSLEESSKDSQGLCLTLAIDYGGEDEINRAGNRLVQSGDETKTIKDFLDTSLLKLPDPDFIIRTSGEYRTSGFMPLQSVYSELFFTETLFPEFTVDIFRSAINDFYQRVRRFGK